MIATLFLALAVPQELTPIAADWDALRSAFPSQWEFPQLDEDGQDLASAQFEDQVLALAKQPLIGSKGDRNALYLGDFVRMAADSNWDPKAVTGLLEGFAPLLQPQQLDLLGQLLLCDGLRSPKWKPSNEKRDGMVFGPTWELPKNYWRKHKGSRSVEQAATLIIADLASIKKAEHNFAGYFQFPENSYLDVNPKPESFLRWADSTGGPCQASTLDVRFRSDLPFPFSTYSLDLGILHRLRADEDLITYVYGRGDDIHWLAGYDRFWTVHDREGNPVATLLVRQLAFDIAGVPDKSSHRREGLRSGMGNLRRGAEKYFSGKWPKNYADVGIPEFPVIAPEE